MVVRVVAADGVRSAVPRESLARGLGDGCVQRLVDSQVQGDNRVAAVGGGLIGQIRPGFGVCSASPSEVLAGNSGSVSSIRIVYG